MQDFTTLASICSHPINFSYLYWSGKRMLLHTTDRLCFQIFLNCILLFDLCCINCLIKSFLRRRVDLPRDQFRTFEYHPHTARGHLMFVSPATYMCIITSCMCIIVHSYYQHGSYIYFKYESAFPISWRSAIDRNVRSNMGTKFLPLFERFLGHSANIDAY